MGCPILRRQCIGLLFSIGLSNRRHVRLHRLQLVCELHQYIWLHLVDLLLHRILSVPQGRISTRDRTAIQIAVPTIWRLLWHGRIDTHVTHQRIHCVLPLGMVRK